MSEDMIQKLGRFTPDSSRIERDEWLFAAGQASARTPRGWKIAVGILAFTQAATLAAWVALPSSTPVVEVPPAMPPPVYEPGEFDPPAPNSYAVLVRTFDPADPPPLPPAGSAVIPTVPLTAGWRGAIE